MADDKLDITSLVTDAIKAVTDSVAPAKKTAAKKTAAKSSTAKKTTSAKKTTTKKSTTAKKNTSKSSTAKKTTAKKSTTKSTTKKVGKIIFEIDHRQIDIDAIKKKAAKLGGDVYVVTSEKKIYDSNGKSINLF